MAQAKTRVEEYEVTGEKLLAAVKDLAHQGNVRRIAIRSSKGVTLLEIPLVLGIAGAIFAPVWAAVGALAALVAKCTLVIERVEKEPQPAAQPVEGPGPAEPETAKKKAPKRRATTTRKSPSTTKSTG